MTAAMTQLRISSNGRYLVREDGSLFFWLGDTAWELFHRLNREEAEHYLAVRAEQQFTVIQAVLLAEFEGVTTGNAYGRLPFFTGDNGSINPELPDLSGSYSYWDHVDFIIKAAGDKGLVIALLPTWGDKFNQLWGKGPEIFSPQQAYAYGLWLGERYRNTPNIVWVLGGDRPLDTPLHEEIVEQMALGLKAGDLGRHLMTFHPKGAESSSTQLHKKSWLDFNMIQSGHGEREITNDRRVRHDYGLLPVKPTLDAEPCYEDIPIAFKEENGYFDEVDVRKAAYYAMLSGACGHTYGHHSVWSMCQGLYASVDFEQAGVFFIMSWREALLRPGAEQMRHLRKLFDHSGLLNLLPDQEMLAANFSGANHMVAARNESSAFVYCPNGLYADVVMGRISGIMVSVSWYNPRDGRYTPVESCTNHGTQRFIAPTSGRGNDWVLCLETARREEMNHWGE